MSCSAKEECGIVALAEPPAAGTGAAAREAFYALFALQHRGQEAAGLASADGRTITLRKGLGLVSQVFGPEEIAGLPGSLAIGHTRYSTTGASSIRNAQPFYLETKHGPIALAHNGNLVNAAELRSELLERGVGLSTGSDSEVMIMMLAAAKGATWPERIAACKKRWTGAFSFVVLTSSAVYAGRDPWGFRPLCAGRLPRGGSAAASESSALRTIGSADPRDLKAGSIVELRPEGPVQVGGIPAPADAAVQPPEAACVFEYVYFSRPDSEWRGISVREARRRFGAALAAEAPADADIVIAVPDSSISAAIGYSQASGIPYDEGFVKNRYIGRTFIEPTEALRQQGVALKFNVMPSAVRGKRIVMVDDSIVRGNTTGPLVRLLRDAGAAAVHVRISSPPIRHPCYMGVDMGSEDELIAARLSVEEIRDKVGADSLAYLSLDAMLEAAGGGGLCSACFSGLYPFAACKAARKNSFECCRCI